MAKDPRSLHGKVVAITGGGRGIGRATALALAREGARVAVGDLDREATKRGVVGLSEAVRLELRGTGVDVSVVMPGIVRTELTTGLADARGVKTVLPEDVAAEIVAVLQKPRFDVVITRS